MSDTVFDDVSEEVVTVTPPGSTKKIHLRYPSFDEWHSLAKAHFQCEKDGRTVDAALIAKTIATCLANEDGAPLTTGPDHRSIMDASPRRVMWLYRKCWATVLKSDEDTVKDLEKN